MASGGLTIGVSTIIFTILFVSYSYCGVYSACLTNACYVIVFEKEESLFLSAYVSLLFLHCVFFNTYLNIPRQILSYAPPIQPCHAMHQRHAPTYARPTLPVAIFPIRPPANLGYSDYMILLLPLEVFTLLLDVLYNK